MTSATLVPQSIIQGMHRVPWMTGVIAALVFAIFLIAGPMADALVYDRAAVLSDAFYRLLTGHLVHLDARHLAVNAGAFVMLGAVYETSGATRLRYTGLMLGAFAAISATLFVVFPQTAAYCGLSAALNALYAAILYALWRDTRHWLWLALLAGGLAKIAWEWRFGSVLNDALAWPPHYGAHLAGFLFGIAHETIFREPLLRRRSIAGTQ